MGKTLTDLAGLCRIGTSAGMVGVRGKDYSRSVGIVRRIVLQWRVENENDVLGWRIWYPGDRARDNEAHGHWKREAEGAESGNGITSRRESARKEDVANGKESRISIHLFGGD
jgi:hypothetical protein